MGRCLQHVILSLPSEAFFETIKHAFTETKLSISHPNGHRQYLFLVGRPQRLWRESSVRHFEAVDILLWLHFFLFPALMDL